MQHFVSIIFMVIYMNTLFNNIDEKEKEKILKTLEIKPIRYSKNEIIITDNDYSIGVLLKGEAYVEKYDYDGNRSILEQLFENSLFSKRFYQLRKDISIVSTTECEVLLLDYDSIMNKIKNKVFINNFLSLYYQKIIDKNIRLEILSKRTIRDKLLSYFLLLAKDSPKQIINLPFTYTDLADYLFVDRSAMMREIKKMKDSGIIKTKGRLIKLLD